VYGYEKESEKEERLKEFEEKYNTEKTAHKLDLELANKEKLLKEREKQLIFYTLFFFTCFSFPA